MRNRFLAVYRAPDGDPQGGVVETQMDFINQILDAPEPDVVVEPPAQVAEPVSVQVPVVEPAPVVSAEPVVPVVAAAPVQPAQEPQVSIEDTLRNEIQRLTALMATGQVQQPVQAQQPVHQIYPAQAQVPAQQVAQPAAVQQAPVQTQQPVQADFQFAPASDYLNADELDRVIDDPKLLLTAIQRAQQDIVKQLVPYLTGQISQTAQALPQTIQQHVSQAITINRAITDFYDANPDLRAYAQFTQLVMGEVEQKYLGQNKTYAEMFEETASETRKRLGLAISGQTTDNTPRRRGNEPPAFAGNRSNPKPATKPQNTFFDTQAADMFSV